MRFVPRTLSKKLLAAPDGSATLILGSPLVGKTTLLKNLFSEEGCLWLGSEDRDGKAAAHFLAFSPDVNRAIEQSRTIIVEADQALENLPFVFKHIIELAPKSRLFVTSSTSSERTLTIARSFGFPLRTFPLMPLSLEELSDCFGYGKVCEALSDRLVYGSYPAVIDSKPEEAEHYLSELCERIVKDIFVQSEIRKPGSFQKFMEVLACRIGSICSNESLARDCGLSVTAVSKYLSLLERFFLVKVLPSYSKNYANELKKSKKLYFCDVGLRNAVLRDYRPFAARGDAEQNALFENFFVLERIKFGLDRESSTKFFFWRTKNKAEIDLLEVFGHEISAFDVRFSSNEARAPCAFGRAYPDILFFAVNRRNFQNYLL